MANRLTALAGFHDSSLSVSQGPGDATSAGANGAIPAIPPGMETDASISLMPPPPVPSARPAATRTAPVSNQRPKTPPAAARARNVPSAPDTAHKADTRRRYGVTIGSLAGDPSAAAGVLDGDEDDDEILQGGKSLDSEAELRRMREEFNPSADLPGLRKGDVTTGSGAGLGGVEGGPEDSGQWGTRAMSRRIAQGTNLKQLQARIDALTTERDDLKIEVDYHRRKGGLGNIETEVITLKQEKLTHVKKIMNLNDIVRKQDKAMTQLRKANKSLEGKQGGDTDAMAEEIKSLKRQLEVKEREKSKFESEVDFLKSLREDRSREEHSRAQNLTEDTTAQDEIAALKEDHRVELYRMEVERDDLADQLEDLKANIAAGRGGRRSLKSQQDSDVEDSNASGVGERSIAVKQLQESLKEMAEREEEYKTRVEQAEAQADSKQNEIDDLQAAVVDLQATKEALEREIQFFEDKAQVWERKVKEEGEDASREMEAMQSVLEDRMHNEVKHHKDQVVNWKLKCERAEEELEAMAEIKMQLEHELREAEAQAYELEQQLEETEREADELDNRLAETERQFGAQTEELEVQSNELEDANAEVRRLSALLEEIEASQEAKDEEIRSLRRDVEDVSVDQEAAERKVTALHERLEDAIEALNEREEELVELRQDYQQILDDSEQLGKENDVLIDVQQELKDDLAELQKELDALSGEYKKHKQQSEQQLSDHQAQLRKAEEDYKSMVQAKDMDLEALESHVSSQKSEILALKDDLHKVQTSLRDAADQSQRLGQSHVNDKYALELEVDRLKREVAALERELDSSAKSTERKEDLLRDRDAAMIRATTELRELASKLASEQQARLGVADRLEAQSRALRDAQAEADDARHRLEEMEHQRSEEDRNKSQASDQAVGQVKERNLLLLSIYQSLGRILGSEKGLRKREDPELKPFTNFGIFHDSLLQRLRRLSELPSVFELKAKEVEQRFMDKFSDIKKQQDGQLRQLNRLEQQLKTAADQQGIWRSRIVAKQAELDAAKATNSELHSQISSLKTRTILSSPSSNAKLTTLTSRANNAERKLQQAQSSQHSAEERLDDIKRRHEVDESKWAARIKELELRCKAAEEKASRDRQSARERVKALEEQKKRAESDLQRTGRQSKQLDQVLASPRVSSRSGTPAAQE